MLKVLMSLFASDQNKYNQPKDVPQKKSRGGWKQKPHWRKIRGKHVWCGGKEK